MSFHTQVAAAYFAIGLCLLYPILEGMPKYFTIATGLVPLLAGWRVIAVAAPLLVWTYLPEAEVRRNLAFYFSWPIITLTYLVVPYALENVGRFIGVFGDRLRYLRTMMVALTGVLLVYAAALSLNEPPEAIQNNWFAAINQRPTKRARQLKRLIKEHLGDTSESFVTQFDLISYVKSRPQKYLTQYAVDDILTNKLRPDKVFMNLQGHDPFLPMEKRQDFVAFLRSNTAYEKVIDEDDYLIYRKRLIN